MCCSETAAAAVSELVPALGVALTTLADLLTDTRAYVDDGCGYCFDDADLESLRLLEREC
jgi:hypothetical protein